MRGAPLSGGLPRGGTGPLSDNISILLDKSKHVCLQWILNTFGEGQKVLDVAGGSGKLSIELIKLGF